jgi:dTDP-4-dehydrorhamnose 3,5-epimerase-like enzyme
MTLRSHQANAANAPPFVRLPEPFVDERGSILNLRSMAIGNVSLICSKRGSIRSNHYHKNDWHYLYMLKGRMLYFERDVGCDHIPEATWIWEGQMVLTRANMEHAVLFLENSEVLSMARDTQVHKAHEADVVRVNFLTREHADRLLEVYP